MSLRVDLEKALEALRNTCTQLESDILALEDTVAVHFDLRSKPVPAKVLQGIEKAINGQ